ncbi:probable cysteine protease RD21C [Leguminivora glycinivorella]|uniref:probable cysteine protease RD21C n=1 Tax=Leguminivora glycinivorella TaxID=1035111 RepID=UPI00200F1A41|nr:probable cysteine protease RD21C [Leguminivora glycinivorella]
MKTVILTISSLALFSVLVSAQGPIIPIYDISEARSLFDKFILEHKKEYSGTDEYNKRYDVFVKNLKTINQINSNDPTTVADINEVADCTDEENRPVRGFVFNIRFEKQRKNLVYKANCCCVWNRH